MRAIVWTVTLCAAGLAGRAHAALVIQVDRDGVASGTTIASINPDPRLRYGTGTSPPSVSTAASSAPGLNVGNSIFGGSASLPNLDTYIFRYMPGVDADNRTFTAGQNLGNGNSASGLVGGGSGTYAVYGAWPATTNVNGGLTTFSLKDAIGGATLFTTSLDQNSRPGNAWVKLGTATLLAGGTYDLFQVATTNTAVSMRSSGVMFELVTPAAAPEPSSVALLSLCGAVSGTLAWRKRRKAAA